MLKGITTHWVFIFRNRKLPWRRVLGVAFVPRSRQEFCVVTRVDKHVLWIFKAWMAWWDMFGHFGQFAYVCICLHMFAYVCICLHMFAYVCICLHMFAYVCILLWEVGTCWEFSSQLWPEAIVNCWTEWMKPKESCLQRAFFCGVIVRKSIQEGNPIIIVPNYWIVIFTPLRVGWPPTPQVYFGPWEGLRVVFPREGSPS